MRKVFGVHLILIGLGLTLVCVYLIDWQQRAVTAFTATAATIDHSELIVNRGGKGGPTYSPDISYHYVVKNHLYISQQVTPFHTSDRELAGDFVDEFPPGAQVFAYVNPADPTDVILVRQYQNDPYVGAFFFTIALIAGLGLCSGLFGMPAREMIAVPVEPAGTHLLVPTKTLRRRLINALVLVVSCVLFWPPILAHYAWVSSDFGQSVRILALLMAVVYLGLFFFLWRAWRLTRYLSDPRLTVSPAPMKRGQPFQIQVEFDVHSPLNIHSVIAQITCFEHYCEPAGRGKYTRGKRWLGSKSATLTTAVAIAPGQMLSGQGSLTFPESAHATTDRVHTDMQFPYYTWELLLQVDIAHGPDYLATYPLLVN